MNGDLQQLMEDSLAGSALALFAGDALGAPVEGLHLSTIAQHTGWVAEMEAGVRFPAGTYTDDTQLMVGILQALAEDDALPAGLLAQRFAANYEAWRGYGSSTGEALRRLRAGEIPAQALSRPSFGNGGAMGIAPLGVYFSRDPAEVAERADAACRTTHHHPEAIGGAVAVACCAALAARSRFSGQALEMRSVLERLLAMPALRDTPMAAPLARLDPLSGLPRLTPRARAEALAGSFEATLRAVESVPIAIGAALSAASLREAVEVAVNTGGDSDTQGAMAGGIAGAYFGAEALPASWLAVMENGAQGRDYIRALAKRLAAQAPAA